MSDSSYGFRNFLRFAVEMGIGGTCFHVLLVGLGLAPKQTDLPLLIEAAGGGLLTIALGTILSFVFTAAYINYVNWRYSHWSDIEREHIDRGES